MNSRKYDLFSVSLNVLLLYRISEKMPDIFAGFTDFSVRLHLSISEFTMAQHQPLFEMLFDQHLCLLTTQETVELMDLPPAGPGELYSSPNNGGEGSNF